MVLTYSPKAYMDLVYLFYPEEWVEIFSEQPKDDEELLVYGLGEEPK